MDINRTKDAKKRDKTLKKYSPDIYAKWIPCTDVDENGLVHEGNWENPEPNSGRWGVYTKELKTGKPYLIYIVETPNHNYRDISYDIDMKILYSRDKQNLNVMNPRSYNQARDLKEKNREKKEKENKRFSEENREKAKDMWGYVSNRPYVNAGIDL